MTEPPALQAWLEPVFANPPHLLGGEKWIARLQDLDAERVLVYPAAEAFAEVRL